MSGAPITAGNDRAAAIRLWLLKNPRPSSLRVFGTDGREHDVQIKQGSSWSDAAVSVAALNPDRLEAYTAEGALIRAVELSDLIRKEEQQAAQQQATFSAMQTTDPETQRMIVFAELLERGYAKAYESSQQTIQVAFTQLQEFSANLATAAAASQESANNLAMAVRNLLVQQAQEAVEAANTEETSPMEKLAANFLTGQQMQAMEAAAQAQAAGAAGKTNGAKTNGARTNGKHS